LVVLPVLLPVEDPEPAEVPPVLEPEPEPVSTQVALVVLPVEVPPVVEPPATGSNTREVLVVVPVLVLVEVLEPVLPATLPTVEEFEVEAEPPLMLRFANGVALAEGVPEAEALGDPG
jgi:hypothetical protein